jgi:hypothetical protein
MYIYIIFWKKVEQYIPKGIHHESKCPNQKQTGIQEEISNDYMKDN